MDKHPSELCITHGIPITPRSPECRRCCGDKHQVHPSRYHSGGPQSLKPAHQHCMQMSTLLLLQIHSTDIPPEVLSVWVTPYSTLAVTRLEDEPREMPWACVHRAADQMATPKAAQGPWCDILMSPHSVNELKHYLLSCAARPPRLERPLRLQRVSSSSSDSASSSAASSAFSSAPAAGPRKNVACIREHAVCPLHLIFRGNCQGGHCCSAHSAVAEWVEHIELIVR